MCHLAIARCEQSVGNTACEAEALVAASRSFLRAERKIKAICCPSIEDHLTAGGYITFSVKRHLISDGIALGSGDDYDIFTAIHTYGHAIRIMDESGQSSRAAGLCLELATALRDMDKTSEATAFYQKAADLRHKFFVIMSIVCLV